jgi:two-component system, OmpR family, KDP operon response regulator KdpE
MSSLSTLPATEASPLTMAKPRILIIEDERGLTEVLSYNLQREGYETSVAHDGTEGLRKAQTHPPDLVILDLMLPDADGADVCRQLRDWLAAPILLISAVGDESDKIRALDAGADDYVTKPFSPGELLARCRALLRRADGQRGGEAVIEIGPLRIDLPRRTVAVSGDELHLTPTEFDLLKALAVAGGRPLTHQMLLRTVWGPGYADEMHLLRVNMGRLRDKLEAEGVERGAIETLTGVGYRLRSDGP